MRPLPAILLTLVVLLAGCSKPHGQTEGNSTSASDSISQTSTGKPVDNNPPPGNQSWVPWLVSPEMVNCNFTVVNFNMIPYDAVKPAVPDGYEPVGFVSGVDAHVNLEVGVCPSIVIDNQTVLHNVGISIVLVFVTPPAEFDAPGDVDVAVLEYVTDNTLWRSILAQHGLTVLEGTVHYGLTADPVISSTVTTTTGLSYTITEYGSEDWFPSNAFDRRHHFADDAGVAWFYANATAGREASRDRAVDVAADGGFLGPLSSQGHIAGHAKKFENSFRIEFGR